MADSKMHILLVDNALSHMRCGVSTVSSTLANGMAERGHRVTVYTEKSWRKRVMYPLHQNVQVHFYRFTDNNLRVQRLREELRGLSPDVCCCMLPDRRQLVWVVALLGSGIPLLYSEHHDPAFIERAWWSREGRLAALSGADRIRLSLSTFVEELPDFLRDVARCIPNPAPTPQGRASTTVTEGKRHRLLWVGRLQDNRNQWRLALRAFQLAVVRHPDWELHLLGDGPDSRQLRSYVRSLELGDRVHIHGVTNDPLPHYLSSQAFCFTSCGSGMSMSLLEAMASGLPVVACADGAGAEALIRHGENGLLAAEMTPMSLMAQLDRLMADAQLRNTLGEHAMAVREKYTLPAILDTWEALFAETAACKGHTIMDDFHQEPFSSTARLVAVAQREWLWRDFGVPMPGSFEAWCRTQKQLLTQTVRRGLTACRAAWARLRTDNGERRT